MFGFGGIRRAAGVASAGALCAAALLAVPAPGLADVLAGTTARPTAVAVAPDGTSYVGFAGGGALERLDADGRRLAAMPIDLDGPVDGLAVDPAGTVWVSDGDHVAAYRADGTLLSGFAHDPVPSCASGTPDPASYGGLAVTASAVYVAGRCSGDLEVYSRAGVLRARVDLPGPALPRGVAWGRAQAGLPAQLFVAQPDAARVLVYDAETLTDASLPRTTIEIARVRPGHAAPQPSGLAADRYGQLVVADRANHALYLYDANNAFVRYRVLGHPDEPSGEVGHLDGPTALAQHDQDGGALSGELWVADAGNGRVQRWTTSGWASWATDLDVPLEVDVPVSTAPPTVSGTPVPGRTLTCLPGAWRPLPDELYYRWTRDGTAIPDAETATRVVTVTDEDTDLACVVVAVNRVGSSVPVASAPVPVPGPRSVPVSLTRPAATGLPRPGETLECDPGTWTGAPTSYAWGWLRDGQPLPGAGTARHVLTDDDVDHAVACRVRATNATGSSGWAVSAPVSVTADPTGEPAPPENLLPPTIAGTARPGGTLTCRPGTWQGAPDLTVTWRSGPLHLADGPTYVVGSADVGRPVVCTVRAVGAGGTSTATSSPVTVQRPGAPATPVAPTTACTGRPSALLAGGARWTRHRVVDLHVGTPPGATQLEIADNPQFRGAQRRALSRRCAYRWQLSDRSDGAVQRVYVRFPGAADPRTPAVDAIRYDATAPRVTKAHARWSDRRGGWVLTARGRDAGAGVMSFQTARADGTVRRTHRVRDRVVSWDRSVLQRVRFADRLGNRTGWVRVQFLR